MPRKKSLKTIEEFGKRARSWTFILYPESAPENWVDLIDEDHVAWVESPLHDKDLSSDGSVKKPHVHVLLLFDGNKSYSQILEITTKTNATKPQICASPRSLVRYMLHLDHPKKHQYEKNEIIPHGGADISALFAPTSSLRYKFIAEMIDFINEQNFIEFGAFFEYSRKNRFDDWFPLLCDNSAMVINLYIKSKRFERFSDS